MMKREPTALRRNTHFRVRFWGVRGSYPTSGSRILRFGGRTSCVEVQVGGHHLIFDAGTGIIPLGKELLQIRNSSLDLHIFLSHTHHDHLIGLYFFEPLIKASARLFIFGPDSAQKSLKRTLQIAMDSQFFPIGLEELKAQKKIHSLKGDETIRLRAAGGKPRVERKVFLHKMANDEVTIEAHKSSAHPKNGVLLYRVHYRGRSLVYATDIEEKKGGYRDVIGFVRGADLLIHDAQYTTAEYLSRKNSRRGWGHSTVSRAIEVAKKANVKRLILFHHDPMHNDKALLKMEREARRLFPATTAAYQGMVLDLKNSRR